MIRNRQGRWELKKTNLIVLQPILQIIFYIRNIWNPNYRISFIDKLKSITNLPTSEHNVERQMQYTISIFLLGQISWLFYSRAIGRT